MTVGVVALRLMRIVLPTMRGVAVELPLPQVIPEDDDGRRRALGIGFQERAAKHRLEPGHTKIVLGDCHAFKRIAAIGADEKAEHPGVGSHRLK